jgi:DNA-binding NtrC family response regulator/ligand-binding sensor domain-containing protein
MGQVATSEHASAISLARLSIWVSSDHLDECEEAYETRLAPILKDHGLTESPERGRTTVEGVGVSRLFEVESPSDIDTIGDALRKSRRWQDALQGVGSSTLRPYRTPVGTGKVASAGPGTRRGLWHGYGVRDGLPSPDVWVIHVDRAGQLWLGNAGVGATRYDGTHFVTYMPADGLAGEFVTCFLEDRSGNLWIGATGAMGRRGGVSCYDGDHLTTYTREDGLISNDVWAMVEDRAGNLWFSTSAESGYVGAAIVRYDGHRFTALEIPHGAADVEAKSIIEGSVRAIALDCDDHLWFTTPAGLCRYDGHEVSCLTSGDGLGAKGMEAILEDRQRRMWFAAGWQWRQEGVGVTCYDGNRFETFTKADGLAGDYVTSILEDLEGHLWFGAISGGASRYDGRRLVSFGKEYLGSDWVKSIAEDGDGHLWFATQEGICRFDGLYVANFTASDGLRGVMTVLEDQRGTLWFGTWNGVYSYDGDRFAVLQGSVGNKRALTEDQNGRLWIAAVGSGVSRYDGQCVVALGAADGMQENDAYALMCDRNGILWIGTRHGARLYDGTRVVDLTGEDEIRDYSVNSILEDRGGHVWLAADGLGVCRYDGKTFTTYTVADGLANDSVFAILEDRHGHLWFGTMGGGVSRYDGDRFTTFTTDDGLAHMQVTAILEDRQGHLWFGTLGGGVSRYNGEVFQLLSTSDGLVNDTVQDIIQDRDGNFWIATEGGVTRYRPGTTVPAIRLLRTVADRDYGPADEVHLYTSQTYIAFEFQGSSYTTGPSQMVYWYQLQGYDEEGKQAREGRVEYTHLPQGEYVFQVQAVDRDLNYSEPISVRVSVEPDPHRLALAETLSAGQPAQEFVGESAALRQVLSLVSEAAPTELTVLIEGETGTGKGLAARMLHDQSNRRDGPFVQVNCGAIPEGLVESELFGHERGAFTGATGRKLGKVELAAGGTLFLDEIGDLALVAQAKLLKVLEERTFERVGGTATLTADVRVIAATNRTLSQMLETGHFREDLYFRLQAFPVRLPPLRERREDIPLLTVYFAARMATHLSKPIQGLTSQAVTMLRAYDWPGNVRELEHAVQRAVIVCPGLEIRREDLALGREQIEEELVDGFVSLEEHERRYILGVLEELGWVIGGPDGAAAILGLPASTLRNRMNKLDIRRPETPDREMP